MRVDPAPYERLELRAHSLLADAPLHDVWSTPLPGGGPERTVLDLRDCASVDALTGANPLVRALFVMRVAAGRLFGWDGERVAAGTASYAARLRPDERAASLVPSGTQEGPFRVLLVRPHEAISEVQNATVHAFSVLVLVPEPPGYRLFWAIHVRPGGRLTRWYMRAIDPFRRWIVYPAALRAIRAAWVCRTA